MADNTDVKQLLLSVDATTELLRRNLDKAQQALSSFQQGAQKTLDVTDKGFSQLGSGLDRIAPAIARTNAQIGTIGATAVRIQKQVEASSSAIASALAGAAGALSAAFSVQKVAQYADAYTRFTNSLKVAGLEGGNLNNVQAALFQTAQKYGAPLEAIGTLYGRAAQTGKQLGASQADLLRFTDAVGASLKVQGGSVEEARGALLQLSQALGTGTVHAEEFNSVNEGLRPILQAAADASDKYRGSVAAMRADVLAGKLSSQDLFRLILAGYAELQQKASTANLTIGASLQVLNNALGQYIGQTDASLSITQRFGQAIQMLANNLDTILPAITSIGIGFAAMKAGGLAFDGVASVLGRVAEADQEVARQVLLGNAQFIDRAAQAAKAAIAAEEEAQAELTAIQATIVARREEQAVLAQTEAELRQIAAAKRAEATFAAVSNINGTVDRTPALKAQSRAEFDAGVTSQRLADARTRQSAVTVELAAAEAALAPATARAAAATEASVAAQEAATLGARAAAGATALFAGALNLLSGALPLIAISAVVAAVIHWRSEAATAAQQTKDFAERHKEAAQHLRETAYYGGQAAGAIAQAGSSAASATGKMLSFAGSVGEAAQRLRELADARRKDQVEQEKADARKAQKTIDEASARFASRQQSGSSVARFGYTQDTSAQDAADLKAVRDAQGDLARANKRIAELQGRAAESFLSGSEKEGGIDVAGKLAQVTRDLAVARQAGIKSQIATLEAEKFGLDQYKKYRKQGLSPDAARDQSQKDQDAFRNAAEQKANADASKKADRESASAKRKAATEQTKQANDTRAYYAAERQALDSIAQSNADLENSAAIRAQIERDKIKQDLKSKNDALDEQGPGGTKTYSAAQVASLKALNQTAADRAIDVINLKERRRVEQDALDAATKGIDIQRDLLGDQSQLAATAAQRRTIELQLLDLQKREEKLRLERILALDSGASESERAQAELDYKTLDQRYGSKQAVAISQTRGPAEQYLHDLNARDINEQLQSVQVDGLNALENGLTGVISGTKSVGAAFKDMAASIVADLARIAIEQAIIKPLANSLFSGSGFFSFLGGHSGGGTIEGHAGGGLLRGPGTGMSDSILAATDSGRLLRVADGEFVVNANATRRNLAALIAMNADKSPGLASGGMIGSTALGPAPIFTPAVPDMAAVGQYRAGSGGGGNPAIIRIEVGEGALFEPRVTQIAGNVSVQTVRAAAPEISRATTSETIRQLGRRSI